MVPPQRWAYPDPLNPANPSSPFYTGRPIPQELPSSPPPSSDWDPVKTLALSLVAYVSFANAGAALTMSCWNKDKRPYPSAWDLTLQWIVFFAIWVVTLPLIPVLFGLQLLVQAFVYWRYSTPAAYVADDNDNDNDDTTADLEGQELQRHIDALDTEIASNTSMFRRVLVAFVGLPPLRAGKLTWAAENRRQSMQAREERRAERRRRQQAYWTLPPYDGVVLPPYETLVVETETDDSTATTAATNQNQGDADGGFTRERVVGGSEALSSTSQQGGADLSTAPSPPPAYH
ncbi:hypothetical protein PG996_004116 [Apiospora saccharicola]|uniref:Uncharacterized protein n=1 Tax=Apiospora saccharicola TaxID=335842 RepID=A0ABR1W5Y6_9PEZI